MVASEVVWKVPHDVSPGERILLECRAEAGDARAEEILDVEISDGIPLPAQWHFRSGDDPAWRGGEVDLSQWALVSVGQAWEDQGFPNVDGFAWYRVVFPFEGGESRGYRLIIPGVDEADRTFLNGAFIGETGGFPPSRKDETNRLRAYEIQGDVLRQGDNVLAIQVFDLRGPGGLRLGAPALVRGEDVPPPRRGAQWLSPMKIRIPGPLPIGEAVEGHV